MQAPLEAVTLDVQSKAVADGDRSTRHLEKVGRECDRLTDAAAKLGV
jgi:hypothetical protein